MIMLQVQNIIMKYKYYQKVKFTFFLFYCLSGARSRQVLNTLFSFHYNNNSTPDLKSSKQFYNKNLQII